MGFFDKLRSRNSPSGDEPNRPGGLTRNQADELLAVVEDAVAAGRTLHAANVQLRDSAMRAVARNRRETVLVDRPGRIDPCFGLITLAEDGHTVWVYEGEIIETDGTEIPVGAESVTLPDGRALARGTTGYFSHVWQSDAELRALLDGRPELKTALGNGAITVRYVIVDAHADGAIKVAEFTLHPERLNLGL